MSKEIRDSEKRLLSDLLKLQNLIKRDQDSGAHYKAEVSFPFVQTQTDLSEAKG